MHRYRKGAQDVSDAPLRASSVGTVQPPVRAQTFSGQVQSFNSYSTSLDPQNQSSALSYSYEPQQPAAYGRVYSASPSPYPQQSPAALPLSSYSQVQSAKPSPYGQTTSAPSPYSQTQSIRPSSYHQPQTVSPYAQTQSAPSPYAQSQSAPSPYGSPFYIKPQSAPTSYPQPQSAPSPYSQSQSTRPSPYSQVQSRSASLPRSQEVGEFSSNQLSASFAPSLEQPSTGPIYQSASYQAYSPPPLPYSLRGSDLSPVPEASHYDEVKENLSVSSAAEKFHVAELSANFSQVPVLPIRHSEDDNTSQRFDINESAKNQDLGLVSYGGDPIYSESHEPTAADFEDFGPVIKPESIAEALPPSIAATPPPPESIVEALAPTVGTTPPPESNAEALSPSVAAATPPRPEAVAESLPPSIAATPSDYVRMSRSSSKQSQKISKDVPSPGSTVKALWDFSPSEESELAFKKGDEITVIESVYRDWWRGELRGKSGIFPTNYVEVVQSSADTEKDKKSGSRKSSNSSIVPSLFQATLDNDLKQPEHTVNSASPPTSPSPSIHGGRMLQDADKEAYAHSSDVKSTDPPPKATLYLSATDASTVDTFAEESVMQASEDIEMGQIHPSLISRLMNILAPRKHQYKQTEATGASLEAAIDHANASFWSRTRQHSAAVVADFALKQNTATSIELDANTNISTYTDEDLFRKAIGSPLFMGFRIIYVLDNQNMAESAISHYFSAASTDHLWKRFRAWSSRIVPARAALRKASRFARIIGTRLRRDFACGFEHNDRFSTSLLSGEMHRLLDVVKAAHDCGAYQRCLFNTVSQTPRHAVYFCHDDNRDQRTLIIVHSRPLHYVSLDNYPRSWASDEIWRNLRDEFPHNVSVTSHDQVMFILLRQVFLKLVDEVVQTWNAKLEDLQNQFGELESSIYADPSSNDDLSTDLWKLSKHLLEARELMGHHVGTIAWIQRTVNQLAIHHASKTANVDAQAFWESMRTDNWLQEQVVEMDELAQSIEENLREPIDKTLDLMYKSISIRDAKLSLELNASLWRLSWITFIFLPLTFLVGFFGMNVDTFHSDPSIKWYFVTAVPFMALVFLFWLLFKKTLSRRYDNRRRRLERATRAQKKNN